MHVCVYEVVEREREDGLVTADMRNGTLTRSSIFLCYTLYRAAEFTEAVIVYAVVSIASSPQFR